VFIGVHPRLTGLLALLCVGLIAILNGKPYFTNASRPPRRIASPLVAMEVVHNVDEVDAILGDAPSPDREAMRIKQYADFVFIACYAGLFLTLSAMAANRWVALCGLAAAGFDVLENIAILRILDLPLSQTTQSMIDSIRHAGLAKWTLAFAALALLSPFFLKSRRWTMRIVGVLIALAAAVGFYGLYDNAFLVWAGIPMAAGIAGIAALFFRLR